MSRAFTMVRNASHIPRSWHGFRYNPLLSIGSEDVGSCVSRALPTGTSASKLPNKRTKPKWSVSRAQRKISPHDPARFKGWPDKDERTFEARPLDAWKLWVSCSSILLPALPPVCPQASAIESLFPAVNREFKKSHDKKAKSLKLGDLTPQKDAKGGAGKTSAPSNGPASTVPTSLDEFLKRDSLAIKRWARKRLRMSRLTQR